MLRKILETFLVSLLPHKMTFGTLPSNSEISFGELSIVNVACNCLKNLKNNWKFKQKNENLKFYRNCNLTKMIWKIRENTRFCRDCKITKIALIIWKFSKKLQKWKKWVPMHAASSRLAIAEHNSVCFYFAVVLRAAISINIFGILAEML